MLINFGRVLNAANNATHKTTFPIAHKNTIYLTYATADRAMHWVNTDTRTNAYINFYVCDYGNAVSSSFSWMTIGT